MELSGTSRIVSKWELNSGEESLEKLLEEETKVSVSSPSLSSRPSLLNSPLSAEEVLVRVFDAVFFFLARRFFFSAVGGGGGARPETSSSESDSPDTEEL